MKHIGTRAECEAALEDWSFAAGYPFAPTGTDPAEAEALKALWWSAEPSERIANGWQHPVTRAGRGPFAGWSLRPQDVETESGADRGSARHCLEMPDDLLEIVVPACAPLYKRTLGAQRLARLSTARARLVDGLPDDWKHKGPDGSVVTERERKARRVTR